MTPCKFGGTFSNASLFYRSMLSRSVGIVGAVLALPTLAATEPQSVDMGPVQFIPTLGVLQRYDDNIFRQAAGEVESWVTMAQPQLQFIVEKDANVAALTYFGDYGRYSSGSDDNYVDHTLSLDARLEANDQHRFRFAGSMAKLHDARGEGSSEGVIASSRTEPDEYDANNLTGTYDFGRESAMLGLAFTAGKTNVKYTNNLAETQFRDRDDTDMSVKFYGRLASRTRFFVELARSDISYDTAPIVGDILDSKEQNVLLGAEWDVTGKTTGVIKVGRLSKDFDAASQGKSTLTNWQANVSWSPRTYSTLSFTADKSPQETNGTGSFIKSTSYSVFWMHDWSSYLHSSLNTGMGKDAYENDQRQDDRMSYGFSINYDFRTWLNAGAGYSFTERESNIDGFDYDRGQFMLSMSMSL